MEFWALQYSERIDDTEIEKKIVHNFVYTASKVSANKAYERDITSVVELQTDFEPSMSLNLHLLDACCVISVIMTYGV